MPSKSFNCYHDSYLYCSSTNLTSVRNGATSGTTRGVNDSSNTIPCSIQWVHGTVGYSASQTVMSFDTSEIPSGATITSARLDFSLGQYINTGNASTYLEWFRYDYTPPLSTSPNSKWNTDWHTPTELDKLTLIGQYPMSSITVAEDGGNPNTNQFVASVPDAAIKKGGITGIKLVIDRFRDSGYTPPSTNGAGIYLNIYSVEAGNFLLRPVLHVTWEEEAVGFEHLDSSTSGLVVAASGSGNYLEHSGAGLIRKAGTEGSGSLIISNGHILTKK